MDINMSWCRWQLNYRFYSRPAKWAARTRLLSSNAYAVSGTENCIWKMCRPRHFGGDRAIEMCPYERTAGQPQKITKIKFFSITCDVSNLWGIRLSSAALDNAINSLDCWLLWLWLRLALAVTVAVAICPPARHIAVIVVLINELGWKINWFAQSHSQSRSFLSHAAPLEHWISSLQHAMWKTLNCYCCSKCLIHLQ